MNDDRLLRAPEVAEMLGLSTWWVLDRTRSGDLPAVALPGSRLRFYRREAILEWVRRQETGDAS